MLTALIIHPSVFSQECLSDKVSANNLRELLGHVVKGRALLIMDEAGKIRVSINNYLSSLDKGGGIYEIDTIRSYIEHIWISVGSGDLTKVIQLETKSKTAENDDIVDELYEESKADFIIVNDLRNNKRIQKKSVEDEVRVVCISDPISKIVDYIDGPNPNPIEKNTIHEVLNGVGRVLRYAKEIRIYDPYLAKKRNVQKYRLNLEYLFNKIILPLNIWRKEKKTIIIYTLAEQEPRGSLSRDKYRRDDRLIAKKEWDKIEKNWNRKYGRVEIKLKILEEQVGAPKVFRSRYLFAVQYAYLTVIKGFDIFLYDPENQILKEKVAAGNHITLGGAPAENIQEIERLPTAF